MQREFRIVRLGAAGALGGIERAVEPAAQHLGADRTRHSRGVAAPADAPRKQARRLLGTAAAHQHLGGVDHGPELAAPAPPRRRASPSRPPPRPGRRSDQQRGRMKREFGVFRRQRRGGHRGRDRLVDPSRRRQSAAQMAMPLDPIRAQLDQPAIGGGGLAMAAAIAEDPGADAQQRRIAPGLRKAAPHAGERILTPPRRAAAPRPACSSAAGRAEPPRNDARHSANTTPTLHPEARRGNCRVNF